VARRYAPPGGSSTVAKIAADLRPSADGSAHLWWPAVAKLQAASVPITEAAAPWDRQTDVRIAVSLNATPPTARVYNNEEVDGL